MNASSERAMLFIDGSNWYHALDEIGVDSNLVDYSRFAKNLVQERELLGIRYYVGKVLSPRHQKFGQEQFIAKIQLQNVQVYFGRMVTRLVDPGNHPINKKIKALLETQRDNIPQDIHKSLEEIISQPIEKRGEKQVDVHLAVDLVDYAHRDKYDVAYLLSADEDFVPAVRLAQACGKRVIATSALPGTQLSAAVNTFIPLTRERFPADAFKKVNSPQHQLRLS